MSTPAPEETPAERSPVGLLLGPALAAIVALIPISSLSFQAHALCSLTVLMAIWWMTEALPVAITALIPLAVFPLVGISPAGTTAAAYGHDLVWLFFGGFQLAFAVERWGLHRRAALALVRRVGTRADRLVLGFMLASGLLSMWLLNTSTTLMMLPVAMAVVETFDGRTRGGFAKALMLGIAYAASVGGMGTYVGTAPNGVFAGVARSFGVDISFADWMRFAAPLSLLMILGIWLYLTRFAFSVARVALPDTHPARAQLATPPPPWSAGEKRVAVVFALVAAAWILRRPVLGWLAVDPKLVSDTTIGIVGCVVLYLVPVPGEPQRRALLSWAETERTPWQILLLFGGGFALAAGFQATGLSAWIGGELATVATGWPTPLLVLAIVLMVTFLTEVTSNTATATVLLPVIGGLAVALELSPALLMLPATLAASCAFMLPVATPPNAIVYASGRFSLGEMARAGFFINLGTAVAITAWVTLVGVPSGG